MRDTLADTLAFLERPEAGWVEGRRGRRSEMLERSKFREVGEIKDVGEAGKGGVRRSEGSEVGGAEEVYAACRMTYDAWRALHEIRGKEMGEKGGETRRRKGQKGGREEEAGEHEPCGSRWEPLPW